MQLSFAPTFQLTSPGTLAASLYMFDEDGLRDLHMTLSSTDTLVHGDSLLLLTGDAELTRPVNWVIPAGVPSGTPVRLVYRVTDFAGFTSTDSISLAIQ